MTVEAGQQASFALNVHILHVLQSASLPGAEVDAGLPARGLHGEGYRGHVFWDELFVFPLLNLRLPLLTRQLLLYRYRRLDEARQAARQAGHRGAIYPWQSGSDGREETPAQLYNPRSGTGCRTGRMSTTTAIPARPSRAAEQRLHQCHGRLATGAGR